MSDPQPQPEQKPIVAGDWKSLVVNYVTSLDRAVVMSLVAIAVGGAILYFGVTQALPMIKDGYKEVAAEMRGAFQMATEAYSKDQDRDAKANEWKDRMIESMAHPPRSVGYAAPEPNDLSPPN